MSALLQIPIPYEGRRETQFSLPSIECVDSSDAEPLLTPTISISALTSTPLSTFLYSDPISQLITSQTIDISNHCSTLVRNRSNSGQKMAYSGRIQLDTVVPREMFLEHILPFVSSRADLISVSAVCKKLRAILHSKEAATLWDKSYEHCFQVCIDGYCPVCHFNKLSGSLECATRFLSKCPISRLLVHSFIVDIPRLLAALSRKGTLRRLTLSLTYQKNSPCLMDVLSDPKQQSEIDPSEGFKSLKELVLDSAHLTRVRPEGRARLLDYLGHHLEFLSFRHLSPAGVFSILETRCPKLKHLRVDRAQLSSDLEAYHNPLLEELELKRCSFIFSPLRFPALRKLRFSAGFRMEAAHIKSLVAAMPKHLTHLSVEVPSSLANQLLVMISRRLPMLEHFTLEGAYESATITPRAVYYLTRRCTSLKSIQIRHAKSVDALSFQSIESIDVLRLHCLNLTLLRMRYDSAFLPALRQLLSGSTVMTQLVLWQRKRWMDIAVWQEMESEVKQLQLDFPRIQIHLEDV